MSDSDKDVETQIREAGEKLLHPPSSVDDLLSVLDKLFLCLSEVEQSPPGSMQNAISPLMKALIAGKLFKHSDADVKVAVAACFSEITRITAPEAPYGDEQMREVFKLIISSLENLVDKSSPSYSKRISILETVAKVRSCVVMLDLECDALLIEMFQMFLKTIRDHHSENVFSSMESIMTLVLEESEDIPPEMLSPFLQYVRKDDEVPQVSRRLAEQVLSNCASKLKTYLTEAVKSSGVSFDKFSNIVASICEGTMQQDQLVANEKEPMEDSQGHLAKEAEVEQDKPKAAEISTPEQIDAPKDESSKTAVSNGVVQQNDSMVDIEALKEQDDTNGKNEPQPIDNPSNAYLDNTPEEKPDVEKEIEVEGKEPSPVQQADSPKASDVKEKTEPGVLLDSIDVLSSSPDDSTVNAAISSEKESKTSVQALPSKTSADETANVGSPSRTEDLLKESPPNKKKESSAKEAKASVASATDEVSEELNTSEDKVTKKSGKKTSVQALPSKTSADETANVSSPSRTEDLLEESPPNKKKESSAKEAKASVASATDEVSEELNTSEEKVIKKSGKKALPSKTSADETANVSSPSRTEDLLEESPPNKKKESSAKEARASVASATDEVSEELNASEAKVTKKSGKKTSVQALPSKTSAAETANVGSLSRTEDLLEESPPNKKKESSAKEARASVASAIDEVSEELNASEAKVTKKSGKKTSVQALPSKTSADETANVGSPSRTEDLLEESPPNKKKESSAKEAKASVASATDEVSEELNTSEEKVIKKSGKKIASSSKAKPSVPPSKKSTSKTKVVKQSEKKAVESDNAQESSNPKEEKKKTGRGKAHEVSLQAASGDGEKPAVSSGKSASKSKKEAKQLVEETPNTNSKRKRSAGQEKASDIQNFDESLVGSRVKVWWPMDRAYYKGVVNSYDSAKKKHLVFYDDGDQESLNLKKQKWYFQHELESSEDEEAADQKGNDEETSTAPQRKKAKTTGKQSKMVSSGKKGGGAGSSKSKATPASKSGKKSQVEKTESEPMDIEEEDNEKEDNDEELSEEEENPKTVGKSSGAKSGKSKDQGSSGKSKVASSKKKEEPSKTPTTKSKSGPAKSSSAKGKAGKGKAKPDTAATPASKAKESDAESDAEETPIASETATKGKAAGAGKSVGSQTKSGKKRRR